MRRIAFALVAAVALPLTGCGGSGDTDPGIGANMAEALAVAPADTGMFEFGDSARWRERHKFTGGDTDAMLIAAGSSAAFVGDMWAAVRTDLGLGWSAVDTVWSATITDPKGKLSVYRLRSDVDMAKVSAGLKKAGYSDKGDGTFTRPMDADAYTQPASPVRSLGAQVRVVADKHLVLARMTGSVSDLPAGKSLANADDVAPVVADAGDVDYAVLQRGERACGVPGNVPPQALATYGVSGLKPVEAAFVMMKTDTDGTANALYASADDAKADQPARAKVISGNSMRTARPFAEIAPMTVAQDDKLLRYTVKPKQQITVRTMTQTLDAPWAWCDRTKRP